MARLRKASSKDADFLDGLSEQKSRLSRPKPATRSSPRKRAAKSYTDLAETSEPEAEASGKLQIKSPPKAPACGKQRRLLPLQAASRGACIGSQPLLLPQTEPEPRRCNKSLFARNIPAAPLKIADPPPLPEVSDSEVTAEVEVEESVWCGSDASSESEDELPSPRKLLHFDRRPKAADDLPKAAADETLDLIRGLKRFGLTEIRGEQSSRRAPPAAFSDDLKDASRPGSSSDEENNDAVLRFSPPRLHSRPKQSPGRPVTPPQSPSKPRLQSPSKTKSKVPSPKIRQSLDAFWNVETVNEWNDQYSPRKMLRSPKKLHLPQQDSSSPTTSPRKSQSPTKRSKSEREARQAFEDQKHAVAEAFFGELDDRVTEGKIRALAASTGGVRFIWSKTLNTTAGRANWRRETTKTRNADGTTTTTHKHHASIELAEKVINDEHRLLNVIAHEFCHLANFMISGIKDQPHGAQFKAWGRACTKAFADRGVEVTTKHSYEIEYKYIWRCSGEDCESEFKRHSKSIDPKRHTCGQCRSKLVQIKPTPRATAKGNDGSAKEAGGFAGFVKMNFAATKAGLPPGSPQKAVMAALGKAYRAEKASVQASRGMVEATGEAGRDDGLKRLAEGLEVIEIRDD